METLLQAQHISKSFGVLHLFEDLSFSIMAGQKQAFIAKNGTGKTTLLQIIAGQETADSGEVSMRRDLNVGYLPQQLGLHPEDSVLQAAFSAQTEIVQATRRYNEAYLKNDTEALQECTEEMDRLSAWDFEVRVKQILSQLQIDQFESKVASLSGGEQKRLALAAVLIPDPELLILDEPTNHLDLEMIEWLEDFLSQSRRSLLMVTHDRYFLENVCDTIIELDQKQLFTYQGNYSYYLEKRQQRIQQKKSEIMKAQNLLRKESEWMRRMPKARGHKAKYRIENYYELKKQAGQTIRENTLDIEIPFTRLGKKVMDIFDISKAYGDKKLFAHFNYKMAPGEKIGIIGKNGTGKTTLLNVLSGEIPPDNGHIEYGSTLNIAYYKQSEFPYKPGERVIDAITKIAEAVDLGKNKVYSASQFLSHFLFPVKRQQDYIYKLSGGEKRRLYLCSILIQKPNFLILDEPTNDLDIISLQVLEEYLMHFQGVVVIVSHDRYFMDKIVDHTLVFHGDGKLSDFPGNYSVYRDVYARKQENSIGKKSLAKGSEKKKTKASGTDYSKRLTYKEKFELQELEEKLEKAGNKREQMEERLNSGDLSLEILEEYSRELHCLSGKIDGMEMRWLELQEKKQA